MAHIPQRHLRGDGRRVARRAEVMAEPPLEPRLCRRATLGTPARPLWLGALGRHLCHLLRRRLQRGEVGESWRRRSVGGRALRASVTVVGELRPLGTEGSSGGDSTTTLDNTGLSVDAESWMGFPYESLPSLRSSVSVRFRSAAAALRSARRRARARRVARTRSRVHTSCAHTHSLRPRSKPRRQTTKMHSETAPSPMIIHPSSGASMRPRGAGACGIGLGASGGGDGGAFRAVGTTSNASNCT